MYKLRTIFLIALIMGLPWVPVAWADLNEGLLVYFSFNKGPMDGIVPDESGNGNNGTVIGKPTYEPDGVFGGAYYFAAQSGSSSGSWYRDYITLKNNPTANVEELTVSLWIKTNTPGNNYKVASAASWSPGSGWVLGTHYGEAWSSDGTTIMSNTDQSICKRSWAEAIPAGKWVHLVISYNGNRYKQYLNGKIFGDCIGTGKAIGDARGQKLAIAAWPQHGFGYDGLIDEFRVYNRGLSDEEINELYTGAENGDCKHAVYSLEKRTLTVPFIKVPVINFLTKQSTGEIELWTGSLRQVFGTTNRFNLQYKTIAQITDGSSSSCPATYAVETGTLSIPYIDVPTGVVVGNREFNNSVEVFKATLTWEPLGRSFVVQEVE